MNSFGDTHVSFAALDVSFSSSGKYILASTDRDRLILFDRVSGAQVRGPSGERDTET